MGQLKVFDEIEFNFDFEVFSKKINLEKFKSMEDEVKEFVDKIVPVVRPKALYKVSFVDKRLEDGVVIDDVKFSSKILKNNLNNIERVFPFIATCGQELENLINKENDQLKKFWIDKLKEMALTIATNYLKNQVQENFKIYKISSMNPGSADREVWPLSEQQQLFSLFGDVEDLIGVKLTDSNLMIPNKSVSGIYFPADEKFINCEYCTRKNCPSRRAPHDPDKWE